ncbi:MAG: hypothetical protein ACRDOJ_04190 [Nocardioidaceae bacterium]
MPLTRADVGHRVVVRRVLPGERGPSGGQAYTDVLGVLEAWEEGTLVVRRADGSRVHVPEAEVAAAKTIPPPPARRSR